MTAVEVTVVVPTFSRPDRLHRLLDALACQTFAAERFEVLVVDDGSPADARPAEPLPADNQHLHRQANRGPAAARNAGAGRASGELLVFIDDDCVPDADWLQELVDAHRQAPDAMLGGCTDNGLPDNPFSATSESLMHFFDEEALRQQGQVDFLASNNLALAKAGFDRLDGFDTAYPLAAGEDRELCRRWLDQGMPLRRVRAARIHHFHHLSFKSFWRQHQNYGRGAARFHALTKARAKRTPPGFYLRLLSHPLTSRPHWSVSRRLAVTALVFVSQLAITSGLIRERSLVADTGSS